jgi:hypothetical protein
MKKRQRWTLGRTRRAARRREGRCRRQRPRFARRARRWFRRATNMILEVSLGLAVGYVEALERQLLAGWRGRLLALLQERPPLEVLADADDAEQLALEPPEGYAVQGTAVRLPNGTWIEAEALAASDVRHDGRCPVLAAWMHALVAWQSAALSAGFRLASAGRLEARAAIRDGAVIVYVYEGGGDRVGPAHVRGGTSDQRHAVLSRLRTLGLCAGGHNAKAAGLRWLPVVRGHDGGFSVRLEAENLRLRNENAALRAAARKPDKGE